MRGDSHFLPFGQHKITENSKSNFLEGNTEAGVLTHEPREIVVEDDQNEGQSAFTIIVERGHNSQGLTGGRSRAIGGRSHRGSSV